MRRTLIPMGTFRNPPTAMMSNTAEDHSDKHLGGGGGGALGGGGWTHNKLLGPLAGNKAAYGQIKAVSRGFLNPTGSAHFPFTGPATFRGNSRNYSWGGGQA